MPKEARISKWQRNDAADSCLEGPESELRSLDFRPRHRPGNLLIDFILGGKDQRSKSGLVEYVDHFADLTAPPASAFYRMAQP